ncbi:hypothetical protein Pan44_14410 [Caulifigura coniformis]|uniref:Uncharacterized protein n=1 Tax=Caulifigura coniformis TaxID=2527983 RepID=A0A517SBD7_9PLAN|nr:hypothetical protein [Caulifigura coniformis]QDT53424.1 hypothetical protein Pan44_14410 [Caulifigura coniformis]
MKTTLSRAQVRRRPPETELQDLDDVSPFGLQGLRRDGLKLLKSECINRLAMRLVMWGDRKQIRDEAFAAEIIRQHRDWVDEYEVVHLIEKSLWINGQSDLVMTLTRNPSQIPDSPPPEILKALTRAHTLHPDATVWFGVPLFGEEQTPDGLPIPLTAQQVRDEHDRRIRAAQAHALNYGAVYRSALRAVGLPFVLGHVAKRLWEGGKQSLARLKAYRERIRRDARRRQRARLMQELEYTRYGRCWTEVPEHSTLLGRSAEQGLNAAMFAGRHLVAPAAVSSAATAGFAMAKLIPMLFMPMTIVAADPFLFVELPSEPRKLRHIGHWYWHGPTIGRQKLHLHV